jgi:MarR family transcriptional regulator for hemolysin
METNQPDSKLRFGVHLVVLARRWRHFIDQKLAEDGLTDASWTPLIYLARLGDGLLQKELAAASSLDESSLVRLIDILAKRGLLERRVDKKDRRARRLYLTDEGRAVAERIQLRLTEVESEMLADVSEGDIAAAISIFMRIDERLQAAARDKDQP